VRADALYRQHWHVAAQRLLDLAWERIGKDIRPALAFVATQLP